MDARLPCLHCIAYLLRHAAAIERVAVPHADSFDRLLLAQCEVETLRLLTADKLLAKLAVAITA